MAEPRRLDDSVLRDVAEATGGIWKQLESDLVSHRDVIEREIASTRNAAFALGLAGTPAYVIGHRLVNGALSLEEFEAAFRSGRET